MPTYRTQGSCSREIIFQVNDKNELTDVKFLGGCSGNLQGIAKLVKGKDIDYIIETLKGIRCKNGTSCPDQLAKALISYKDSLINAPEEDSYDEEQEEEIEIAFSISKKKKEIEIEDDFDDEEDDDYDDDFDEEDEDEEDDEYED